MKIYDTVEDCIRANGYCDSKYHFIRYRILLDDGVYNVVIDGNWVKAFPFRYQAQEYIDQIRNKK